MSDVFLAPKSKHDGMVNPFAQEIKGGKIAEPRLARIAVLVLNQLDAIKEGKVQEAYDKYTSNIFRRRSSLSDFKDFVLQQPTLTNFKVAKVTDGRQREDVAVLKAKLIDNNDEPFNVIFILHMRDDEWRVSQMLMTAYFPTLETR